MVELPNADRLKQLPLRAVVAYAVRCAMRVQLLFLKWQDNQQGAEGPPAGMAEAVEEAIKLATRFAADEGEYDLKRGQELEETVIEAVMRAKGGHRGAAFAANAAYAALNAANLAFSVGSGINRRAQAEKVVLAVITAADAAAAAHEPVIQAALDDWHTMQLMRFGQFPDLGSPVDPRPHGKLGPLTTKKAAKPQNWKKQSPTLRQFMKHDNVLEQTRDELQIQKEERKKDQAEFEAKCDEYEKTIRHLKAEVIPLKMEREDLKKQVKNLEAELKVFKKELTARGNHLIEFANQLLEWTTTEPESESDADADADADAENSPQEEASQETDAISSSTEEPDSSEKPGEVPKENREPVEC